MAKEDRREGVLLWPLGQPDLVRIPGDGVDDALKAYKTHIGSIHLKGRKARLEEQGDGLTLADLGNAFLNAKLRQQQAGEISSRTFAEYRSAAELLVGGFGETRRVDDLRADDFETLRAKLATRFGPVRLGNTIQYIRTVLKYGYEAGLIDKPVRYGPQFKKPSASVLRRHRAKTVKRFFDAAECHTVRRSHSTQWQGTRSACVLSSEARHFSACNKVLPWTGPTLLCHYRDFPRGRN